MAISTTVQVVRDGHRNAVVHVTGRSDGNEQEVDVAKVVPGDLNPPCDHFSVLGVRHTITNGAVTLAWDAVEPVPFTQAEGYNNLDYSFAGGLHPDVSVATDMNGSIVLTTHSFAPDSSYDITLTLRKKY